MEEQTLAAIVVAAGSSRRMDGIDKIWAPLAGRPILAHSCLSMAQAASELIVVIKQADEVRAVQMLEGLHLGIPWRITRGGARRQDSVRSGLASIRSSRFVAIHDAARPLATPALLDRTFVAARACGAAIPALMVSDTVKRVVQEQVIESVDRSNLWAVQTPQVFSVNVIRRAYRQAEGADELVTDDAMLVERTEGSVAVVQGELWNFKVTTPGDLEMAEALLSIRHHTAMARPA